MLKSKNKVLVIILAILGIALVIKLIFGDTKGSERSFKKYLIELNTDNVDKLTITNDENTITMFKEGNKWYVSDITGKYFADQQVIGDLVNDMSAMKIEKLVSTEKTKWKEYEVDDTLGVKVSLFKGKKRLAEVIVGRFSYRQTGSGQGGYGGGYQLSTMVRLNSEKEIYSIEGAISMQVKRSLDNFRDKTIISFDPETVQKLEYIYPADSSFTLALSNGEWLLNSEIASIGKVINFLNEIKETKGNSFTQDVDTENVEEFQLRITTNTGIQILVKSYKTEDKYVFITSQNEGVLTETEYLFKKIFPSADKFLE